MKPAARKKKDADTKPSKSLGLDQLKPGPLKS